MNALLLGLRTVSRRPLPAVLTVLLLMLGIATVVVLLLFERALEDRLGRDARGIDLVVGAKGSGLQLVLSAVFHIDVPTGNVPLSELRDIARHPMVAGVIPLSLGMPTADFASSARPPPTWTTMRGGSPQGACGNDRWRRCWGRGRLA